MMRDEVNWGVGGRVQEGVREEGGGRREEGGGRREEGGGKREE